MLYAKSPPSLGNIKDTGSYYHAKAYDKKTFTSTLRNNSRRMLIIWICTSITVILIAALILVSVAMLTGCTKHTRELLFESKCRKTFKRHNPAFFAITVVSVFANVYTFCVSWTAMSVWAQDHFNALISDLLDFDEINYINRSLIALLAAFNTILLFVSVSVLGVVAAYACRKQIIGEKGSNGNINLLCLISVLCACLSICAHSPYIAVACLNDQYHAIGILICYLLLSCFLFGLSWIAFIVISTYLLHKPFVHLCCKSKRPISSSPGQPQSDESASQPDEDRYVAIATSTFPRKMLEVKNAL